MADDFSGTPARGAELVREADIACPFFKNIKPRSVSITCEGCFPLVEASTIRFRTRGRLDSYMRGYCCDLRRYSDCALFKLIYSKYRAD